MMPRPAVALDTKKLQATARPDDRAVADPAEYRRIFALTLARRDAAQRLLDATPPEDWMHSPAHRVLDQTTSQLIRMAAVLNFGVVVPQRPAAVSNEWQVLRGGIKKAG
jgi:hypothetical protein